MFKFTRTRRPSSTASESSAFPTHKVIQRSHNARGSSLLEQALVFPSLVLFAFAALDANSFFQAYSALRQGVKDTLRCVYPSDAACVSMSPSSATRLYKVHDRGPIANAYFAHNVSYSGTYHFLQLPRFTYHSVTAPVVDTLRFATRGMNTIADRALYAAAGTFDYAVMTADFPFIHGTNRESPQFSIQRTSDNQGSGTFPRLSFNFNSLLRLASGERAPIEASYTFTVARPSALAIAADGRSLACRVSSNLNNVNVEHVASSSQTCAQHWSTYDNALFMNTIADRHIAPRFFPTIHMRGHLNSEVGSWARLSMRISGADGSEIDLGGQSFGNGANEQANFIPRGAPIARIAPGMRSAESLAYQGIRLRYGTPYTLHLLLRREVPNGSADSGLGNISWRASGLDLYLPQYRTTTITSTCPGRHPLSSAESLQAEQCPNTQLELSLLSNRPGAERAINRIEPPTSMESYNLGCTQRDQGQQALLQIAGLDDQVLANYRFRQEQNEHCPSIHHEAACPENFGVNDPTSFEQLNSICPLPLGEAQEIVAGSMRWSERSIDLIGGVPYSFEARSCRRLNPEREDLPAHLQRYARVTLGERELSSHFGEIYTDQEPLEQFISENPDYQCAEMAHARRRLDNDTPILPEHSLFRGERAHLGCSWRDQLSEDAIHYGAMDPAAYLESELTERSEVELTAPPSDSCVPFRIGQSGGDQWSYLGQYNEDAIPVICTSTPGRCSLEFVGFEGEMGGETLDSSMAAQRGALAVQAAYPRARFGCSGADCFSIGVEQDGSLIRAHGEMRVALNLLLRREIPIRISEARTSEASFARK